MLYDQTLGVRACFGSTSTVLEGILLDPEGRSEPSGFDEWWSTTRGHHGIRRTSTAKVRKGLRIC
jgi:hypothetical protein